MSLSQQLEDGFLALQSQQETLLSVAQMMADHTLREKLLTTLKKTKERRFRVAVIGEFSTGKSTFLNALLGGPYLPMALQVCTSVVTRVSRVSEGIEEGIIVDFKKAGKLRATQDELQDILTFQGEEDERGPALEAMFYLREKPLLEFGVELVDTPGVNDTSARGEQVTLQWLPNADAIVFLTHAARALKASEMEFLRERLVKQDRERVLVVINACDLLEEEEDFDDLREHCSSLLKGVIDRHEPFFVSARQGLQAQQNQTENLWENSGMKAFHDALRQFLEVETGQKQLLHLREIVLSYQQEVARKIQTQLSQLQLKGEVREHRIRRIQEGLDVLERDEKALQKFVDDTFARLGTSLESSAQLQTRKLKGELQSITGNSESEVREKVQDILRKKGRVILSELQSELRQNVHDLHKDLARRIQALFGEIDTIFTEQTNAMVLVREPNWSSLIEVHTHSEQIEKKIREKVPSRQASSDINFSLMGGGIFGFLGACILGPLGFLAGAAFGAGLGSEMAVSERSTPNALFKTVKEWVTRSKPQTDAILQGVEHRYRQSIQSAMFQLREQTVCELEEMIRSKREELTDRLHEVERPNLEEKEVQAKIIILHKALNELKRGDGFAGLLTTS